MSLSPADREVESGVEVNVIGQWSRMICTDPVSCLAIWQAVASPRENTESAGHSRGHAVESRKHKRAISC